MDFFLLSTKQQSEEPPIFKKVRTKMQKYDLTSFLKIPKPLVCLPLLPEFFLTENFIIII